MADKGCSTRRAQMAREHGLRPPRAIDTNLSTYLVRLITPASSGYAVPNGLRCYVVRVAVMQILKINDHDALSRAEEETDARWTQCYAKAHLFVQQPWANPASCSSTPDMICTKITVPGRSVIFSRSQRRSARWSSSRLTGIVAASRKDADEAQKTLSSLNELLGPAPSPLQQTPARGATRGYRRQSMMEPPRNAILDDRYLPNAPGELTVGAFTPDDDRCGKGHILRN